MTKDVASDKGKKSPVSGLVVGVLVTILSIMIYYTVVLLTPVGFSLGSGFNIYFEILGQLCAILCALRMLALPNIREAVGELDLRGKSKVATWVEFFIALAALKGWTWLTSECYPLAQESSTQAVKAAIANGQAILVFIYASVLAPLLEELLFRHAALTQASKLNGYYRSGVVVLVSLLFSFSHLNYQHWTTHLALFELGLLLSAARIRSGGLALPIALHGAYNAINFVMLATGP